MYLAHKKIESALDKVESKVTSGYSMQKDFLLITKPELIYAPDDFRRAYKVAAIEGVSTNRFITLNKVITAAFNKNIVGAIIPTSNKNLDESCQMYFQDEELIREIQRGKTIARRWEEEMNKISPEIRHVDHLYTFSEKHYYNQLLKKAKKMTDREVLASLKETMAELKKVNFRSPKQVKDSVKYQVMSGVLFERGYDDLRRFFPL